MSEVTLDIETMHCWKCLVSKPLSAFSVDVGRKGGLNRWCKVCVAIGRGRGGYLLRAQRRQAEEVRGVRTCTRCGVEKPREDYLMSSWGSRYCAPCRSDMRKEARARINADPVKREASRTYSRKYQLSTKYGLTPDEFELLFARQGRRCAICGGEDPTGNGWTVDHSHLDQHVRGIVHGVCNTGIGHLGDTLEGVIRAVVYLARDELGDIGPDGWWPAIRKMMVEHITYMNSLPPVEFDR